MLVTREEWLRRFRETHERLRSMSEGRADRIRQHVREIYGEPPVKSLQACSNRVVVAIPKVAGASKSSGGIVLPDVAEELMTGEVQSVGKGRSTTEIPPCKRGDMIIFPRADDYPVLHEQDGLKYIALEFHRVLAVKKETASA